jgi:hypothetical protein
MIKEDTFVYKQGGYVKIHYNDFMEATQNELRKTYKIGNGKRADMVLENQIRRHLDGANQKERTNFYSQFYLRNK